MPFGDYEDPRALSLGLAGDAGVAEQIGLSPSSGGMLSGAPALDLNAVQSLGLAKPARTLSDQDYLQNLPTMQKIGLMLQAFSAGVAGQASPVEQLLKSHREEQRQARQDLLGTTAILTKALEESRRYGSETLQGKAVLNAYKKLLPPEFASALDAIGTDQEDTLKSLTALVADPDVQAALVKSCGRDRACWQKQVNDKDWLAMQYQAVDVKRMAVALPKLRAFKEQVLDKGGLDAKKDADGKVSLTWPELVEGNAKLKLFSDAEMDTFKRNPDYLIPYGIKTTRGLSAGEVEAAKIAERPTKEDFKEGATRRILDPQGHELQQEFKSGEWVTIGRRLKEPKEDKPLTLGQELHDERVLAAREQLKELGVKTIDEVRSREAKEDQMGRENKRYVPGIMSLWRRAGEPLYADKKAEREAAKAKGTAPKASSEDAAKRFAADAAMKGNTLGKKTEKGYEVFKNGKLIGYYR